MKKAIALVSLIAFLIAASPRKAHTQVLEGALIGAAIGGTIGLVMSLMKPKQAEVSTPDADNPPGANVDATKAAPAKEEMEAAPAK